ncbi:MAG TPA: hypothetical protein VFV39_00120 [Limnobacter sp.]|nr:hypothetical protein [Limnobacter sp.]
MSKRTRRDTGMSMVNLLVGVSLVALTVASAVKVLGTSLSGQNTLNTENLVDQVNRIGEIMTVHLNRGGSFKNPEVEAKGIQICSLQDQSAQCNGYDAQRRNMCLSIPTRVSLGGKDVINITGFRLLNGTLAQRDMNNVNMAAFDHGDFCADHSTWLNLNNPHDFEFTQIRFCRFAANTPEEVTRHYEQNCVSVIQDEPETNQFWLAMFKARLGNKLAQGEYEEARVIHLLNTTRVKVGS